MDEERMLQWVNNVWKPYAKSIHGHKLLLIDVCTSHMTHAVHKALTDCKTEAEFIPPGFTSKLQVMDVGLNKPFKDQICHLVESFLTRNPMDCAPSRQDVSHWIATAWNNPPTEMKLNHWRHIGYTGVMDAPHPNRDKVDMNNHHDPLALVEVNATASPNDDDCDTDSSFEY